MTRIETPGGVSDPKHATVQVQAPDGTAWDVRDPALADHAGRVGRVAELDAAIEAWTLQRSTDDAGVDGADRVH